MGVQVLWSKWIWPLRVRGFSEMKCDVKTNAFRCVVLGMDNCLGHDEGQDHYREMYYCQ